MAGRVRTGRRRGRAGLARARRLLAAVGLAGLVAGTVGPWRGQVADTAGDLYDRVRRVVAPRYEPARPVSITASSERAEHPASLAFDGVSTTHWAEAEDGPGVGASLTLGFDPPVDLGRIGITPGDRSSPEAFVTQPRPRTLEIVAGDRTTTVELEDRADFQDFGLDAGEVATVTVTVTAVFGSPQGSDLSIAEIELFAER